MNPEPIIAALLQAPAVLAVVPAQRQALEQLAQGAAAPALVYRAVSVVPMGRLCGPASTYTSRVQINPLATTPAQVQALHALVRTAVETVAPATVAGRRLISARFDGLGPASKDDFTGLWTQPADYVLVHE